MRENEALMRAFSRRLLVGEIGICYGFKILTSEKMVKVLDQALIDGYRG